MEAKLDFMYNYLDYDNDRSKVHTKFLMEMNKRATLEDIGETLDELVIDSKAKNWKHYNLAEHHNAHAKRAAQDYTSEDFKWSGRLLKQIDPKTPLFIDDPSQIDQVDESLNKKINRVYEKIKFNDE
jgi:hypothetical protein